MTGGYLLDTHILIWYVAGSSALGPAATRAIEDAREDLWLSPISVWEVGLLAADGRLEAEPSLRAWLADAKGALSLQEAPLNSEVALTSLEIDLPHRDPADRFLAATALVYDLTLITADRRLLDAPGVPTLG